ncbi:MAG: hypothetical protein ABTQ25_15990 [Nitrosomonas ureae]
MENTILLLQSGGRDSAAAAVELLELGKTVIGVTLSADAFNKIAIPKQRAVELAMKYKFYQWHMIDFTQWDRLFKESVESQISSELPKSCLLCSLSKITAMIPYCKERNITQVAMGYTEYQSTWAEQTPLAIELQRSFLQELGIDFILPVQKYKNKDGIKDFLTVRDLTPVSLENPCCISRWGTQVVSEVLIQETIEKSFNYLLNNVPKIEIIESVGTQETLVCP